MSKRPSSNAQGGEAKRARSDPTMEKCVEVSRCLAKASELPKVVRDMLSHMVPMSLGVPAAERQKQQNQLVDMIEETLQGMEKKMQTKVTDCEEGRASTEKEQESASAVLGDAEATVSQRQAVVEDQKTTLADLTLKVRDARIKCEETKKAQKLAERGVASAQKEKDELEKLKEECWVPLRTGAATAEDREKCQEGLKELMERLELVDSLTTSLPGVAGKEQGARGSFDVMVLDQFDAELQDKLGKLEQVLSNAGPSTSELEEAMASTTAALTEARASQAESLAALKEAEAGAEGLEASEMALSEAKSKLNSITRTLAKLGKDTASARLSLEVFQTEPLARFTELKELAAAPAPEEVAAAAGEVEAEGDGVVAAVAEGELAASGAAAVTA